MLCGYCFEGGGHGLMRVPTHLGAAWVWQGPPGE